GSVIAVMLPGDPQLLLPKTPVPFPASPSQITDAYAWVATSVRPRAPAPIATLQPSFLSTIDLRGTDPSDISQCINPTAELVESVLRPTSGRYLPQSGQRIGPGSGRLLRVSGTVLVLGGRSEIGIAVAQRLVRDGHSTVVLAARRSHDLDAEEK